MEGSGGFHPALSHVRSHARKGYDDEGLDLGGPPQGHPVDGDFALVERDLPALNEGEVRVANRWLSVDPYMRGRMNDTKSYVPPFQLGEPMQGGAIGEVVESRADNIPVGTLVSHMAGWRDEAVLPAAHVQPLPDLGVDPRPIWVSSADRHDRLLWPASDRRSKAG